jgi:hypothetical protein
VSGFRPITTGFAAADKIEPFLLVKIDTASITTMGRLSSDGYVSTARLSSFSTAFFNVAHDAGITIAAVFSRSGGARSAGVRRRFRLNRFSI